MIHFNKVDFSSLRMIHLSFAAIFWAAALTPAFAQQSNVYTLGLTDATHQSATGTMSSTINGWNSTGAGAAYGTSVRYSPADGRNEWFFNGTSVVEIGLTGDVDPVYSYNGKEYTVASGLSSSGVCAGGASSRYSSTGVELGADAFVYSNATGTSVQAGLTGTINGAQYEKLDGTRKASLSGYVNDAGQTAGASDRYDVSGGNSATGPGQVPWFFDGTKTVRIGLHGGVFWNNTGYEYGSVAAMSSSGKVVGSATRYDLNRNGYIYDNGASAWVFNGTATSEIGLRGDGNGYANSYGSWYQNVTAKAVNNAGQVVGNSTRFDTNGQTVSRDLGVSVWVYNGTDTIDVGLTGTGFQYRPVGATGFYRNSSAINTFTDAGHVAGTSQRYDTNGATASKSLGQSAWIYDGSQTVDIGLQGGCFEYQATATGVYRSASVSMMNSTGQVAGYSSRFGSTGSAPRTDMGRSAWFYDGTQTSEIGLTGAGFGYQRTDGTTTGWYQTAASIGKLTDAGHVLGTNIRYAADGTDVGPSVWFFDGAQTREIGLTGTNYSYQHSSGAQYQNATYRSTNTDDDVLGYSLRYSSSGGDLGRGAWLYDSQSATTNELVFSTRSDGYAYTDAKYLSNNGAVIGTYKAFSADGLTDLGSKFFIWSEDGGFNDLWDLVGDQLSAGGWKGLSSLNGISDTGAIYGVGIRTDGSTMRLAFTANQVPEPGTFALLGAALAGLACYAWHKRTQGQI